MPRKIWKAELAVHSNGMEKWHVSRDDDSVNEPVRYQVHGERPQVGRAARRLAAMLNNAQAVEAQARAVARSLKRGA